jgi:hypothetical protein
MRRVLVTLAIVGLTVSSASAERPQSRGPFGCERGVTCLPAQWEKLEDDNGQVYYIDVATIRSFDSVKRNIFGFRGVEALIYVDNGAPVSHLNTGWYMFDCDKPYMVGRVGFAPRPEYLPSRSIGYRLRNVACQGP